jgi:hypothetical protein
LDIGVGQPGASLEAQVELVNRAGRPIRVVGGTSDCSCITTADLPLTLAPGEARCVSVRVRLPGGPGAFDRKAFFWTDHERARTVLFSLTGQVDASAAESAELNGK